MKPVGLCGKFVTIIRVVGRSRPASASSGGAQPAASSAAHSVTSAPHHVAIEVSGW